MIRLLIEYMILICSAGIPPGYTSNLVKYLFGSLNKVTFFTVPTHCLIVKGGVFFTKDPLFKLNIQGFTVSTL